MTQVEAGSAARFVGARARRKEDPRLLTGQGAYVADIELRGCAHVAFVRSPYPKATIDAFELDAARAAPGVRGVLTGAELSVGLKLPGGWRGSLLATTAVSYVGEPVVMVVADSRAEAEDAAELVEVRYTPQQPVIDLEEAVADTVFAHDADTSNAFNPSVSEGFATVDAALAAAPHCFTERIEQHRYVHSPMEGRAVAARWQSATGQLTVWISTQGPHPAVSHFASVMQVDQTKVRVIAGDVGGAFGQKISVSREETAIPVAARLLDRPLRWIEDRYENLVAGPHARREFADVSVATDEEGRILAMKVDHYQDCGAYGGSGGGNFVTMIPGPYRIPVVEVRSTSIRTNTSSRAAYRGPWMLESVLRETMLDLIARRLGIDVLEIRRRNILHREELPYRTGTGMNYDLITAEETMERAVALLDYGAFRSAQQEARREGRYLGVGISVFVEPSAMGARRVSDGAAIRIDTSGKVLVSVGSGSQGHSVETTICQIVADELGVDLADVSIVIGDTAATPFGATTGGSRNAVSGGNSAIKAAVDLRGKVLEIAGHALEASVEDLEIEKGVVQVRGAPVRQKSLGEIATLAETSLNLPAGMQPGLETVGRFTTSTGYTFSNATHVAVCEVDVETGQVAVRRFIVSEDCGVMINPNVVEGQIAGGVIQGIGGVLYEHFVYDEAGNPLTTTYLDYLIPTSTEVPVIEYDHLETAATTNPGGFKGMGEGGAIGAPAAIINAVADALAPFGVEITRQPLTPPRVLALLDGAALPA
ncbi:MAG TPA: xanthine dehydrogenase family protein molybdopterin-binding subunit [Acidimicrobiales bacterium]|nr:xanthine dehydrogenase family protein molybdopterin-binding subunit [Acidimicrobiales bacterium]